MKNWLILSLGLIVFSGAANANDIYIAQVGDGLDLSITQDGTDNEFGDSTTSVTLEGDTMTFTITQTGNNNDIAAIIKGNTYTGEWEFTGDYNTVDLNCDATSGLNCEDVTLDITVDGDSNTFDFDIGENADSDSADISFTVTGDDSVIEANVDGTSVLLDVVVNNSNSLATGGATNNTLTSQNAGNVLDIDITGNGDTDGHEVTLDITGGGSYYNITQSGIKDNTINATFDGDNQKVDITQSD